MSFGAYKRGLSRTFVGEDLGEDASDANVEELNRLARIDLYPEFWGVLLMEDGTKIEKKSDSEVEMDVWYGENAGNGTPIGANPDQKPANRYAAVWNVWDQEIINLYKSDEFLASGRADPSPPGGADITSTVSPIKVTAEKAPDEESSAEGAIDDDEPSGLMMGVAAGLVGLGLVIAGGKKKGKGRRV